MPVLLENHPFSALSRSIEHLLCASIVLVALIAAFALVNMGRLSFYLVPALCALTMAHNLALVLLISRDRARAAAQLKDTLAPTARRRAIAATYVLVALWATAAVVIVVVSALVVTQARFDAVERIAGLFELPLVAVEVCVLAVLAGKCRKQRRATVVRPEAVDWEHLRPPMSARV